MTRWYTEKKKEHFYKEAKRAGYRARSAYKLLQLQNKFRLIKEGDVVLDLGAAPGGWSQVAKELTGMRGLVIGVDRVPLEPLPGVTFLCGDVTDGSTVQNIRQMVGEHNVDVVLSDMSPDISGSYSVDQARSIWLCTHALNVAQQVLKPGGYFVCKAFAGEDLQDFLQNIHQNFKKVKQFSPTASRKRSSEIYIVATGLQNP